MLWCCRDVSAVEDPAKAAGRVIYVKPTARPTIAVDCKRIPIVVLLAIENDEIAQRVALLVLRLLHFTFSSSPHPDEESLFKLCRLRSNRDLCHVLLPGQIRLPRSIQASFYERMSSERGRPQVVIQERRIEDFDELREGLEVVLMDGGSRCSVLAAQLAREIIETGAYASLQLAALSAEGTASPSLWTRIGKSRVKIHAFSGRVITSALTADDQKCIEGMFSTIAARGAGLVSTSMTKREEEEEGAAPADSIIAQGGGGGFAATGRVVIPPPH